MIRARSVCIQKKYEGNDNETLPFCIDTHILVNFFIRKKPLKYSSQLVDFGYNQVQNESESFKF